jgi:hypothetical protein
MSAISSASTGEYVADYDCLIEGVEYFLRLEQECVAQGDFSAIQRHYEENPEDKLCDIYRPGTREMVLCRRSGIDAIHRMARRLIAEAPNGYDLSPKRIAEILSENILQAVIDQVTDDEELVRILKAYVLLSETEHVHALYQFPCVLLHYGPTHPNSPPPAPDQFALGPVVFRHFPVFVQDFTDSIDAGEKQAEEKALDMFSQGGKKYGWVASVGIPRCAPDVSRRRAEEIIEAAINLLKVFTGLRYARSMRLPHTAHSRNRETCVLTEVDRQVTWIWHGASLEGALVAGNPLDLVPPCMVGFAAGLLQKSQSGDRDEATNRLLDALRWFGDASFEESGGVQIVKWIAALERLTATERLRQGIAHNFCKRVALLAAGLGKGNVEAAYRDARTAYDLRSDVMHGSRSQDDQHLLMNTGLVHDLTREAMLGALAVHHLLGTIIRDGRAESMARCYEKAALPHEDLFKQLQREFSQKNRAQTPP